MSHLVTNQELCLPTGAVLAAPSAVSILAAFLPDGTVQDLTALILAANQPGALCNTGLALALVVTDAGSATTSSRVYVEGVDCMGRALAERLAVNVGGSNNYPLAKPFWRIDYCEMQGVEFSGVMRLSLGTTTTGVLGVPTPLVLTSDIVVARIDAAPEAAPNISLTYNTWTPASAPNGARRFYLNYLAQ